MTKPKEPWQCQKCTARGVHIPRATPRSKLCAWCAKELQKEGQVWCNAGKHAVPAHEWSEKARRCRACQTAYNQAYRQAHYEKAIAYSRAYHEAHGERLKLACRAYYQANREQLLNQKREYYQRNAETIKAKVRARRQRGLPPAEIAKMRARHRAKHHIYRANEKLNRARRFLQMIRPIRGASL